VQYNTIRPNIAAGRGTSAKGFEMLRKYLPVALALAAFVAAGTAPALARTRHHSPAHLYMYAPTGAAPLLAPTPDLQVYPNPIQRTGSVANFEDLRPGY
jgi:hypothetical protein